MCLFFFSNLFQLLDGDTCTQIWPILPEEWNFFVSLHIFLNNIVTLPVVSELYSTFFLQSKRFLFLERPSSSVNTDLGKTTPRIHYVCITTQSCAAYCSTSCSTGNVLSYTYTLLCSLHTVFSHMSKLPRFLVLCQLYVCTSHGTGTLLLDGSLRGQLYTREIWIQDMSKEGLDTGVNVYE